MERVLASVEVIKDIKPIDGADKICSYKVKGWNVVDSIDKYDILDYNLSFMRSGNSYISFWF
jgi:hypothetical protein